MCDALSLLYEKEHEEREQAAIEKARRDWEDMEPANPAHPYLIDKKVGAHGIRQTLVDDGAAALVVPVRRDKEIINLQIISGGKWFREDAPVAGGYHAIGGPITDIVIVVEGYATGATIHEITGLPVAVAFDAAKTPLVARTLRAQHPGANVAIGGDDDVKTKKERGVNTGRVAAERVAVEVSGVALLPPFNREKDGDESSDWNDFRDIHGAEASGACFMRMLTGWLDQDSELEDRAAPKYSEADLANMLEATYGHRIRYVEEMGKWFFFNGRVWKEDHLNKVFHFTKKVCNLAASLLTKKSEQGLARAINSAKGISSVTRIRRNRCRGSR